MAQADSTFSTFFKTPGAVRVRVQEILPGAALAAVLAFWGWLAISAVHLREEMARNSENIVRNTESIRRILRPALIRWIPGLTRWMRGSLPFKAPSLCW